MTGLNLGARAPKEEHRGTSMDTGSTSAVQHKNNRELPGSGRLIRAIVLHKVEAVVGHTKPKKIFANGQPWGGLLAPRAHRIPC